MKNTTAISTAMAVILLGTITVNAVGECSCGWKLKRYHNTDKLGRNISFSVEGDTLTVSGSGDMYDYTMYATCPTFDYHESVKKIVIEDGITSIGDFSFQDFRNCEELVIANTVTDIGAYSFAEMNSVYKIEIPDGAVVGTGAFSNAKMCTELVIGDNVHIGTDAFDGISSDTSALNVTIPCGTELGIYTFMNGNLGVVEFEGYAEIPYRAFFDASASEIKMLNGYTADDCAFELCTATITTVLENAPTETETPADKTETEQAETETVQKLKITAQPSTPSGSLGGSIAFHVEAAGDGLTYHWMYCTTGSGSWWGDSWSIINSHVTGTDSDTLVIPIAGDVKNGAYWQKMIVRCLITDANGNTVYTDSCGWVCE